VKFEDPDYLVKVEEEKERVWKERERQREEVKAQKEFEREKARLLKEQAHYRGALGRLGDADDHTALESKLAEIEAAVQGAEDREANIRSAMYTSSPT
jgi:Na+-translocating ferredoxin:NAD+ oxidoreductase RnfC subunit